MADIVFNDFHEQLAKGDHDFDSDTIKVALLKTTYTPAKTDQTWASISTYQASGTNYTAATLAGIALAQSDTAHRLTLDATDVVWTNATVAASYAVLYNDDHGSDALICLFDFGSTQASSNADFTIEWNSEGILRWAQA